MPADSRLGLLEEFGQPFEVDGIGQTRTRKRDVGVEVGIRAIERKLFLAIRILNVRRLEADHEEEGAVRCVGTKKP